MSAPAPPPQFFPSPPFASGNESVGFWPEFPIGNDLSIPTSRSEFPPFKKPRNSEGTLSIPVPNHNMNSRMPPPPPPHSQSNRRISRIFFKTRPCGKFKEGTCPYGSNCNFAHGSEDLRNPPHNWQEIVASHGDDRMGNWDEDQKIINRLKLCKKFYNGEECPYGERCNFLHEDPAKFREDFGRFRESSVISITTTAPPCDSGTVKEQSDGNSTVNSSLDANWVNLKPVSWKTKICNKWETTGYCPFGEKCHFAHGQTELQKFGGHNGVDMGNSGTGPLKPLPNPANDASPNNTVTGTSCKKQVLNKFLLKWKGPEKISRIYADWIDDLPIVRQSPSNLEN